MSAHPLLGKVRIPSEKGLEDRYMCGMSLLAEPVNPQDRPLLFGKEVDRGAVRVGE
jgi:hypothetical protein